MVILMLTFLCIIFVIVFSEVISFNPSREANINGLKSIPLLDMRPNQLTSNSFNGSVEKKQLKPNILGYFTGKWKSI